MCLIEIDQVMALIACAVQQRADRGNESLPLARIGATEQLAGFFHDNLSRCSARRMVSRQQQRPNCACTKPARRRDVQRGFTAAPATGGLAAWCCAVRT